MERYYKMTKAKSNGINTIVDSTKPSKASVVLGDSVLLESVSGYCSGVIARESSLAVMNKALEPFHKGKVKFVKLSEKSKKDTPEFIFTEKAKTMFMDSMKAKTSPITGKAYTKGVIDNLWKTFFTAVNSGKPITDTNSARKKGSKASEDKTAEQLAKDMDKALTQVWSLSDACPDAIAYIQTKLDSMDLVDAIADYLGSKGVPLAE
jgi:hypothetical protein